eukprot:s2347_g3.t1
MLSNSFGSSFWLRPAPATAMPETMEISAAAKSGDGTTQNVGIKVDLVRLLPQQPHTNEDLSIEVVGRVPQDAVLQDPMQIGIDARVLFCRRINDCMPVFHLNTTLCEALDSGDSGKDCSGLKPGQTFSLSRTWHLPLLMVRGTYTLLLQFHRIHTEVVKAQDAHPYEYYSNVINSQFYRPPGDVMSCYTLHEEVLASRQINILRDFRDAIIAFLIAASSSRAIGSHFPVWSRGILPQISGFLFIGILVGPYCANLVSQMHITIIGGMINKVSLAFIAGAAGAEIFLPELQGLLKPMALQVLLICTATVTLCASGIFFLESSQLLSVTAVSMQPSLMAKASICLLMGALMTARSPASAIAIIAELKCGDTKAGSMAIGVTVLSDIAVLVLFALCSQLVRATSSGEDLGLYVLLGVFFELGISIFMGYATGQLMRLALPPRQADCQYDTCTKKGEEKTDRPQNSQIGSVLLGFLLIFILYAVFCVAEGCSDWTDGKLCLEPLLVCTVAACVCGHDELRREGLLEALAAWTPLVLLPFFTLAGASLQLSSLNQVLPAALCLVVLRALGVAAGSAGAGALSRVFLPQSHTSKETVQYTWLTLLAQAGVTLGLVLEVQHSFKGAWTQPFATLIISVVVINQLIGPVCCRFGLQKILAAEEQEHQEDVEMGSCSPSSDGSSLITTPRSNRFHLAPKQTERAGTQSVVYVLEHPPLADGLVKKLNQF